MVGLFEDKANKIYVAGHRGLVGSAIVRALKKKGYNNLILKTSSDLDLRNSAAVMEFFHQEMPDYVFLAAAKVGGIVANNIYQAEFIYDNLMIQSNVIHAAYCNCAKKLLFLGSSCIYPKHAPQPIREEHLMTGLLEPTNEPYAVAKIAGIKMCQAYNNQYGTKNISLMPTNLYGPGDNFDIETSHVIPGLIRKFHEAKINDQPYAVVWGTGTPKREFMHVDDLADACLFLMQNYESSEIINVGTGKEILISDLANIIKEITGYQGAIKYDLTKPDGTPRKQLDITRINVLGWHSNIRLRDGIRSTYEWYKDIYKKYH